MLDDIRNKFKEAEIDVSDKQLEKMDVMIGFLTEYNEKVNLTAIKDRKGIIEKHLLDSVLPLKFFDLKNGAECLDIGTGAGFPAVPMMIYRDDLRFTLLDARRKRTDYLGLLLPRLGVKAEEIIHGRAEELGGKYKGRFDMVTARAVSDLSTLFKYAAPLLRSGGVFLGMRGAKEEMDDGVRKIGERIGIVFVEEIRYCLPCGDARRLVIMKKK